MPRCARLAPLGLLLAVACAPQQPPAQPAVAWHGADWPMYQARADHNAVFPAQNGAGSARAWKLDLKAKVNGGLAYSGGLVYVTTFDYRLIAVDARDGSIRWATKFDNVMMSSPVIESGVVVVGSGDSGLSAHEGNTFAYSSLIEQTAAPLWGRPDGDHVYALDAGTGAQQWSFRTVGEDMPSPVLNGGRAIFANGDGHAYSLDLKSGTPQWQTALPGIATMASATTAPDATAFVSVCGPGLRGWTEALDPRTGKIRWNVPFGDCDASPTYAAGTVFVSGVIGNELSNGYGGRGSIAALDAASGRPRWKYETSRSGFFTRISSSERAIAGTYAHGMFYDAIPVTNELVALDARTGALRWTLKSAGPIKMSPVVSGKQLYVGDTAGILYAIDADTGAVLDTQMFGAPFTTSPPVIVGSMLYVIDGTTLVAEPLGAVRHRASKMNDKG